MTVALQNGHWVGGASLGRSKGEGYSRRTLVALMEDRPGVLSHVANLFRRRNYNIESLTVGHTEIRELALIKVQANASTRAEIIQFAEVFEAKIVDLTRESVTVEITGTEDKVDALYRLLRPFGIKEMVRTGRVAMLRGVSGNGAEKG